MKPDITHLDKPLSGNIKGVFHNGKEFIIHNGDPFVVHKNRWINAYPLFEFVLHGMDIDAHGVVQFISAPDETTFFSQLKRTFPYLDTRFSLNGIDEWWIEPTRYFPKRMRILRDDHTIEWCFSFKDKDYETVLPYNPVRTDRYTFQRSIPSNEELNLPTTLT